MPPMAAAEPISMQLPEHHRETPETAAEVDPAGTLPARVEDRSAALAEQSPRVELAEEEAVVQPLAAEVRQQPAEEEAEQRQPVQA